MNVCIIAQERAHEAAFMVGSQKKRERNAGGREWRGWRVRERVRVGCENGCGLGAFSDAGWVALRTMPLPAQTRRNEATFPARCIGIARHGQRREPCYGQRGKPCYGQRGKKMVKHAPFPFSPST